MVAPTLSFRSDQEGRRIRIAGTVPVVPKGDGSASISEVNAKPSEPPRCRRFGIAIPYFAGDGVSTALRSPRDHALRVIPAIAVATCS